MVGAWVLLLTNCNNPNDSLKCHALGVYMPRFGIHWTWFFLLLKFYPPGAYRFLIFLRSRLSSCAAVPLAGKHGEIEVLARCGDLHCVVGAAVRAFGCRVYTLPYAHRRVSQRFCWRLGVELLPSGAFRTALFLRCSTPDQFEKVLWYPM